MRAIIVANLSGPIEASVVEALLSSYEAAVAKFTKGDVDGCLASAGKFVEHTLRAIEYIRTGISPPEIRSVSSTLRSIEGDKTLNESVRILIPRVAHAMVYEMRSKRGAVHVKSIDPKHIDASLCVHAASWVVAELLRLYHAPSEAKVMEAMEALMRRYVPYVETFGDEAVVTSTVSCDIELLLLLAKTMPEGLDRRGLGRSSKHPSPTVTRALQRLGAARLVHRSKTGLFHITGPGQAHLRRQLAPVACWSSPIAGLI